MDKDETHAIVFLVARLDILGDKRQLFISDQAVIYQATIALQRLHQHVLVGNAIGWHLALVAEILEALGNIANQITLVCRRI